MDSRDKKSKREITRSTAAFAGFTFISRITGFIRDMLIAFIFGTSYVTDAFLVAFRIPNTFRRFVGEGALNPAFIPVLADYLESGDRKKTNLMISTVFTFFTIFVSGLVILAVLFAKPVVQVLTLNFGAPDEKFFLTVDLLRLIFPYLLFVSLAALCMGILNSKKIFWISAAAPIALNISLILAMIFISPLFGENAEKQVFGLAVGVLAGGILQLLFQLVPVFLNGFRIYPVFKFLHEGLKRVIKLMLPTIFGQAIHEVNIIVDTMLAWRVGVGAVSYLYYSNRLMQLPLGVFAIAISTVILPLLSRNVARKQVAEVKHGLFFGMELMLFIMIPCSVFLLLGGEEIIRILFQRGEFTEASTNSTYFALIFYSLGLVFISGVRVIAQVYYAYKDTKTPVKIAAIAMILNIIFNLILIQYLEYGGLALATSLSAFVNFSLLLIFLKKKVPDIKWREDSVTFMKILASGGVMILTGLFLKFKVSGFEFYRNDFLSTVIYLVIFFISTSLVYLVIAKLINIKILNDLFIIIKDYLKKKEGRI